MAEQIISKLYKVELMFSHVFHQSLALETTSTRTSCLLIRLFVSFTPHDQDDLDINQSMEGSYPEDQSPSTTWNRKSERYKTGTCYCLGMGFVIDNA